MTRQAILAAMLCALASGGAWAKEAKPSQAKASQQSKMKKCSAEAKGMKGQERRQFMSGCLKKA